MSRTKACVMCCSLAILLSACASTNGSAVFGNLLAYNSVNAPPQAPVVTSTKVDCPEVVVDDSDSDVRVYAGAERSNDSVRYQFALGRMARQCTVANGQIAIKVGVSGRVLLGPVGSPGSFTVPIRISVVRAGDHRVMAAHVYRSSVVVPAGSQQSLFTTVSEPLVVPFTREQADRDYTIHVGFETSANRGAPRPRRRPKRRRRG